MKPSQVYFIYFLFACFIAGYSQNTNCSNATPFCTGQTMNFPAGVNAGSSQPGPAYGCLGSQPNPAWFFMQIANSGSMSIAMSAANDIDFICWGPFPNLSTACNSLTAGNIQSCSYSGSSTETCTIANAVAGQFYILLITNFSNQNQTITFNQNNSNTTGAASTNCGFVCAISATTSGIICSGQTATISLGVNTSTSINSYTWTGPNAFSSTTASNVISNVQANTTYSVVGTSSAVLNGAPYSGTCQALVTISVIPKPSFSITPTTTSICQGGSFNAGVTFTQNQNPANYSYFWEPNSGAGVWQPGNISTLISPLLLPTTLTLSTVVYSVTVYPTSTLVNCPVTKTLAVTINNPLTPTITPPPPFCDVFAPQQLTAAPGGGTWSANPAVSPGGIFTPLAATIGINYVSYAVNVGTCVVMNTQSISVSRYYSPALTSNISTLCVQDPQFNLMNIVQNTLTGTWSGPNVISNQFNPSGLTTGFYNLTYSTTSLPDPTVCPASTVLVVPVFNPPLPLIDPIPPKCTNSTTVALTALAANAVWSGAAGVSPSGIQTPSLNSVGVNTVLCTGGLGTCVASASRTFQVSQYNPATLTGSIAGMCVTSVPANLMGIVQNTTGSWSGTGVINASLFSPSGLSTGIYTVTYKTLSSPNATLCPDSSLTQISVLNPPNPDITQVGPFCTIADPVQLQVNPPIGQWVSTYFLSSTGNFSPSVTPPGSHVVQYIIGTNTCNTSQTKTINVEGFVSAASVSGIADQCTSGTPVNLMLLVSNNTGNWTGPGVVGTNFNPALSGAGQHTISYHTASLPSGLCPDFSELTVKVYSLATPVVTEIGPFCSNAAPAQIKVSPLGGVFEGVVPGLVTSGGLFNPGSALIGDNTISYSISSGPCIADARVHVFVEKFISADFEKYAQRAYCINAQPFNLVSLVQNPGGRWSGNGVAADGMFDPFAAGIGNHQLTYETFSKPTHTLCPHSNTITIKVKDVPAVQIESNIYRGCAPLEVLLTATVAGTGFESWNLNDEGLTANGLSLKHIFTSPGSYSVVFNYADNEAKGCFTQLTLKEIKVSEMPVAEFSVWPEEISIADPKAELTNYSSALADNRYSWSMEYLEVSKEVNPVVFFPGIGTYQITLTATSVDGCISSKSKRIEVKNDFNVFVPNSFTPNYDGLNDTFKPVFSLYGLATDNYKLEIFDRWGHLLFQTNDYRQGWDGTILNKGEEAIKAGTYIFKLRYQDDTGQVYNKTGEVHLLR